MAGLASKIAKTVAGTAAAAGIYYVGKQNGMQEALGLPTSGIDSTLGVEAAPMKSARPVPAESPEAYHAALNDRANSLRNRIFEKAYSEGSIEERFDKIVGNAYMAVEQAEVPDDQQPLENAPSATEDSVSISEVEAVPESDETAAQSEVSAEKTTPQKDDVIDLKNAKTGDLDPYHRIQKALSTSEFFAEENEGNNPPEFEMP